MGEKNGNGVEAQDQLEGMKDKKDELLSRMIGDWIGFTMEKARLTDLADEKHSAILVKLDEKGMESYTDPDTGLKVSIDEKRKLKVTKPRQAGTQNAAAALAGSEGTA